MTVIRSVLIITIIFMLSSCGCIANPEGSVTTANAAFMKHSSIRANYDERIWIEDLAAEYAEIHGVALADYHAPNIYPSEDKPGWYLFYKLRKSPLYLAHRERFDTSDYMVWHIEEGSGVVTGS